MAEVAISKTLIPGLRSLFLSSKYTDLVIRTTKKEIKVHKLVMCACSGFFARMLEGTWKETKDGVVEMKEDDADNLEKMIGFMYGQHYDPETDTILNVAARIILSVEMYVLADKYDVSALKGAAKDKFEKLANSFATKDEFSAVMVKVLNMVPPTYISFTSSFSTVIVENLKCLLGKKAFIEVAERNPKLQTLIIKHLVNGAPAARTFECYSCQEKWKFTISKTYAHCPKCGKSLSGLQY